MISKQEILNLYVNCYSRLNENDDYTDDQTRRYAISGYYDELSDSELIDDDSWDGDEYAVPEMTQLQWNNLVKVCQTIRDNSQLFDMNSYHNKNICGTTHCIAGWAVCVELNDFNIAYENYDDKEDEIAEKYGYECDDMYCCTSSLASAILSPLIYPFFYLTDTGRINANEILMEEFIEPILLRANQTN